MSSFVGIQDLSQFKNIMNECKFPIFIFCYFSGCINQDVHGKKYILATTLSNSNSDTIVEDISRQKYIKKDSKQS